MKDIETHIGGIPCVVRVLSWEPYVPAKISGPPENCYPAEGGYGDWEVLDRRGKPAPWLARKMTDQDVRRIDQEVFDCMEFEEEDW